MCTDVRAQPGRYTSCGKWFGVPLLWSSYADVFQLLVSWLRKHMKRTPICSKVYTVGDVFQTPMYAHRSCMSVRGPIWGASSSRGAIYWWRAWWRSAFGLLAGLRPPHTCSGRPKRRVCLLSLEGATPIGIVVLSSAGVSWASFFTVMPPPQ
jgi:hypothetical protein